MFNASIKEKDSLSKVLQIEQTNEKGVERGKRGKGSKFGKDQKQDREIEIANLPEVSSWVKKEFVLKNVKSNFKCLKRGSGEVKVMTGYRNDHLMSKSPETNNFIYSEGQNINASDFSVSEESKMGQRTKVISHLRKESKESKDVIYFLFLSKQNRSKTSSDFRTLTLFNGVFFIDKILKIKLKKNSLKLHYFGSIDSEIISLIQKFQMDFEHFIKGKFITKCIQRAYTNTLDSDTGNLITDELITKTINKFEKPLEKVESVSVKTTSSDAQVENQMSPVKTIKVSPLEIKPIEKTPIETKVKTPVEILKEECAEIVKEINEPDMNFNIADLYQTERELFISKRFLEVYRDYKIYINEEDEWKVSDEHKEYTAWARNDGRFIVRKAEVKAEVDLELLEKTMKNFNEGPKWNPMLGNTSI
jgi:hypothetical protein